ncbi:protein O-mannosyl-transferase family [Candidatus Neomarinimicrobiota bacterium]
MLKANRLIAGFVFLLSFILYLMTMAPTTSFWDCGEFIATSYIMGIPHPPGSPLFLLVGRLFTLLPLFEDIGARVNLISPIASSLAVMFLYLVIVRLVVMWRGAVMSITDALIAYGSAAIGAFTFMVTDSHWFNAVEAEVYALSTFFTTFVVWLILRWSQSEDKPAGEDGGGRKGSFVKSNVHYILLLAYLFGLATGLHTLNLLAMPFVALVIFYRKWSFSWKGFFVTTGITLVVFLIIYQGIIKGLPQLASMMGLPAVALALAVLIVATVWAVSKRKQNTSIILTSMLLVVVGYSTYTTIFIRSQHDPAIDENDPETIRQAVAYMEREQYGEWSLLDRARWTPETQNLYRSVGDFFWNYQVKKMYTRYFLWQFAGRGPTSTPGVSSFGASAVEDGVNWFQFGLPLALVLGFFGMGYHMHRDWKNGLAILALFLATGLMIILYLNQPDPQPRERDYSYVGSFFAWSIWIGIGVAGLLELLAERIKDVSLRRFTLSGSLIALLIIVPGMMLRANYHEHDRTGNYVAWDYSYNLLNSCEQDGILFTNGDNDTFPLWYLQEVEGIRKDVRVVNLSLLNTDWYIRQLRDFDPKIPLSLSDANISGMVPIQSEEQVISLPVNLPGRKDTLTWTMRPTYLGRFLRVQDRMIIQIIYDVNWSRPIYFAVTVAPENKIGLDNYLEMQGLVYELKSSPARIVNIEQLRHNLLEVYRYRNLNDPSIYYNDNIQRLMQNLRASWLQLAQDDISKGQREQAKAILDTLSVTIPESVIPIRNKDLYFMVGGLYGEAGDTTELKRRLMEIPSQFNLVPMDWLNIGYMFVRHLSDTGTAELLFEDVYEKNSQNPQIVGNLVGLYQEFGRPEQAARILTDWLRLNPNDQNARRILEQLQQ